MDMRDLIATDPSVPENTIFLLPPDVRQGLDLLGAAEVMHRHGILSRELLDGVAKEVTNIAVAAARERRVAVIKNVG